MGIYKLPLTLLLQELNIVRESAIYFLLEGDSVVYVGQSKDISGIVRRHKDKVFDRIVYRPCLIEELNDYEQPCIVYFRPKYNKQVYFKKYPFNQAATTVKNFLGL
jgi:hypothetical protein